MKQAQLLLLLLFVVSISHSNAQTSVPDEKRGISSSVDPYFVETRDTVSTHGPHTITRNQLQDRNGNYWFASWQGIMKYDGKIFTNYTLKEGLIHFHVFSVFEDSKGNIWFGTIRGGLYKYDPTAPNGKAFTLFTTKDGLADNSVLCMAEDKNGNIWFGTSVGASCYDPSAAINAGGKSFTTYKKQEGCTDAGINTIMKDKTGKLWFGSRDGIHIFDGKSFTVFTNKGLAFKDINALLEDRNGNVWIGGREGEGLCRYNTTTDAAMQNTFTYYTTRFTGYMLEDKKGNLWFTVSEPNAAGGNYTKTSYHQVLYRYDAKLNDPKNQDDGQDKYFTKIIDKYLVYDRQIFGITEDKEGKIWFGTMMGSGHYDGKYSHYFWQ